MAIRKNLTRYAEYQAEYPLAHELPYWDFLEDEKDNCVVLADGTLVQGLELSGIAVEAMDVESINHLTAQMRSFLNSLPDGLELQFFVDVNSDYSKLISGHESLKGDNALISWIADGRLASLKNSVSSNQLQKMNLYLFIYQRITSVKGRFLSFFERPQKF